MLSYHQPSTHESLEQYTHNFLLAFFTFCNKEHLKSLPFSGTGNQKLPDVIEIVCKNKTLIEPKGEIVDRASSNLRSDLTNADACSQQENNELKEELGTVVNYLIDEQDSRDEMVLLQEKLPITNNITLLLLPDNELNSVISSLNHIQRFVHHIHHMQPYNIQYYSKLTKTICKK